MRRSRTIVKLASAVDCLSNVPLSHIGDLTVTFPMNVDLKAIQRSLRMFNNNLLVRTLNTRGLRIIGRVGSRYHVHFLIDFNVDLASGFDWTAFRRYQQLHREWLVDRSPVVYRLMNIERTNYQRSMNTDLRRLTALIQRWSMKQFGRVWLLPVRTNLQACRFYLQSNLPYYRRPEEAGCHWFTTWGLEVIKDEQFSPHNRWWSTMRINLSTFIQRVGLSTDQTAILAELYGTRWRWLFRRLIAEIQQPSPDQLNQLRSIQQNCTIHQLRQQPQ